MDISDLAYSDAGDSSWTMYLDHSSSLSSYHLDDQNREIRQEYDEDSSMVSDASSGPPYYCQETVPEDLNHQNGLYWCKSKSKIKNKKNNKKNFHEEQGYSERFNSSFDDTATSLPVREEVTAHKQHQQFDDFSQSYSSRRIFKGNFNAGFIQQASPVEKLALDNHGGSNQRKRRG